MLDIVDEKYDKAFILFWYRASDGRWFFCKTVYQYYVKTKGLDEKPSDWIKCSGRFFTRGEMVEMELKGKDRLYFRR